MLGPLRPTFSINASATGGIVAKWLHKSVKSISIMRPCPNISTGRENHTFRRWRKGRVEEGEKKMEKKNHVLMDV